MLFYLYSVVLGIILFLFNVSANMACNYLNVGIFYSLLFDRVSGNDARSCIFYFYSLFEAFY